MARPTIIVGRTADSLLSSILSHVLIQNIGGNIVARDVPERELEHELMDKQADVVVLEVRAAELPPLCDRLLHTAPRAVIVGLSTHRDPVSGEREVRILVLHSGETDPNRFADIVIAALQRSLQTQPERRSRFGPL